MTLSCLPADPSEFTLLVHDPIVTVNLFSEAKTLVQFVCSQYVSQKKELE